MGSPCQSGVWKSVGGGVGPIALVTFDGTSCNPSCPIIRSRNIASVQRTGTGRYTIYYLDPLPSSSNTVLMSTGGLPSYANTSFLDGQNTILFNMYIQRAGCCFVDDNAVSIVVF